MELASIHEKLGEDEMAAELREQFHKLWQDADPDLRALVEDEQIGLRL